MGERHPPSPSRTRSETEGDGVGVGVVREGGEAEPEGRRVLWQRLSRDDTVTLQQGDPGLEVEGLEEVGPAGCPRPSPDSLPGPGGSQALLKRWSLGSFPKPAEILRDLGKTAQRKQESLF